MNRIKVSASLIATLALVGQISAGFVDVAEDYNVVTFGNFSDENDQIHGKLAVGGNVTANQFSADMDMPDRNKLEAIVSGGNVILNGNATVRGSIYAAGDVSINGVTVHGDVYGKNITMQNYGVFGTMNFTNSVTTPYGTTQKISQSELPVPVDFVAKKAAAETLSNQLFSASGSSYSIANGVLSLSGNEDINFFTLNASEIESVTDLYIDNLDKEYVINLNGLGGAISLNNINQKNYGTSTDLNYSNILFNVANTSELEIGSIYGNVLAVNTDVTAKDGQMFGSFIANSFSGKYEFHQIVPGDFNPPSDVPEASTITMMVVGGLCLLLISRKKFAIQK